MAITTTTEYKTKIKASKRTFVAKVDIYFDGIGNAPTTFLSTDRLVDMTILEELHSESENPLGLVSSNELTLTLMSEDYIFNPTYTSGPYYGKLLPNVVIKAFIGLETAEAYYDEELEEEVPAVIEYIPMGVYYSGDWIQKGSDVFCDVRCDDGMTKLFDKEMPQVPTLEDTTVEELYEILFDLAGLDPADYDIDPTLNTPIKYGWFEGDKIRGCIQNLAINSCSSVFLDKNGIINVVNNSNVADPSLTITDYDQLNSTETPQKYSKVYSTVSVGYGIPSIGEPETILTLYDITLPAEKDYTLTRSKFSGSGPVVVVDSIIIENNVGVTMDEFTFGSWDCNLTLHNTGAEKVVTIKILGRLISRTTDSWTNTDASLVTKIGTKDFKIDPYLIQDLNSAKVYASLIATIVGDPLNQVSGEIRGDMSIELCDTVTMQNPSHVMPSVDVVITKVNTNFTGALDVTFEGINRASRVIYDWVCVSPGLYEFVARRIT